jgi:glycosyltransferase involved in cell wall biosynthesis
VLGENAFFFSSAETLSDLFRQWDDLAGQRQTFTEANLRRIREEYSWERVTELYLKVFGEIG